MSFRRSLFRIAAPAALLLASACTTPFRANVTRFQMMPPPQGQTFAIQAANPQNEGGIEFGMYARLVTDRLAMQGYRPGAPGQPVNMIVSLDYGIDNGHEKVTTDYFGGYGGFGGWGGGFGGWGGGWGGGFGGWGGGFGYGGFGGYGFGGFGSPFWGPDVESYTYYVSHLDMRIRSAATSQVLFEGRARARSVDHSLQHLVPNLVDAMFTGFPGRSGEDVLISLPPPPKEHAREARHSAPPINSGS